MKRFLRAATLAAAALVLSSASGRFESAAAPDFSRRLQNALEAGRIDTAHATLYRLFAVKAPSRLPAEFRIDLVSGDAEARRAALAAAGGQPHRCGTSDLRAVGAALASLPADLRAEAEALIHPPRAQRALSRNAAGKAVAHALPNWVTTANFSIEWGRNLTNEDGTVPVRDANGNGIPDVVEKWAAYFEAAYQEEVVNRGFGSVSGAGALGTSLIPVYIGNTDPSTTIDDIDSTTYAFTQYDTPTAYIVVADNLSFAPSNQDPDGRLPGAMKVTAAHEFFHVIQFLIMPDDLPYGVWNQNKDDWWLEASSTWMEDEVFDQVNDYWQFYGPAGYGLWNDYVATGLPVDYNSSLYVDKAYGAAIFGKYLSEHAGGHAVMESVWKDYIAPGSGRRPLDALDALATAAGFSGLGGLFQGYAAANATMDYREGAHYGSVQAHSFPTLTAVAGASGLPTPSYLGTAYLLRAGVPPPTGLTVNLGGAPSAAWGLALSLSRGTSYAVALGATSATGTPQVSVSSLGASDTLYGVTSYLSSGATATTYATTETAGASNPAAPRAVSGVVATPAPGGLDLDWGAVADATGYIVEWRRVGSVPYASRTVFGPVTRIELRGLSGSAPYEGQVFAYGATGKEGAAASFPTTTTDAATPPATPTPSMTLHVGDPWGTGGGSGSSSSGGGGGGGGPCFIAALSR